MKSRYEEFIEKLNSLDSFEKTANTNFISPLSGIKKILDDLDHPEIKYKTIHVAGTNGKGQTSSIISKILEKGERKVGLYTSPQIINQREGIQFNNSWITEDEFIEIGEHILTLAKSYNGNPFLSYFDIITTIAFEYFYRKQVDWAVIEVGIGGIDDSTNVIDKSLSVITKIDYDHMGFLGNSIELIADKKLGIVPENGSVVVADQDSSVMDYLKKRLIEKNCKIINIKNITILPFYERDVYQCTVDNESFNIENKIKKISIPTIECIRTALAAINAIENDLPISKKEQIKASFEVSLPGRLQLLKNIKYIPENTVFSNILFDGGHNSSAIQALCTQIKEWKIDNYILILGMAKDKLTDHIKSPLIKLCQDAREIIIIDSYSARAASSNDIQNFIERMLETSMPNIKKYDSIENAMRYVSTNESQSNIVMSGSFYLLQYIIPNFNIYGN